MRIVMRNLLSLYGVLCKTGATKRITDGGSGGGAPDLRAIFVIFWKI